MRKLPVFKFEYDAEYGGGIMLIAAWDSEAANKHAQSLTTGFGRWMYSGSIIGLSYESKDIEPVIIEAFTHVE